MKRNKTVIGITGGIGAGKSTVLSYIAQNFRTTILYADEIGRELMEPGESVYEALKAYYGTDILNEDGTIDRTKLSEIAFRDEESQLKINEIEHPLIREEILNRIRYAPEDIVFVEAALLKEGGLSDICREVWYVTASKEARIERLMTYRKYSYEKCISIMDKQLSEEEFTEFADEKIDNSEDLFTTSLRVNELMRKIGAERI